MKHIFAITVLLTSFLTIFGQTEQKKLEELSFFRDSATYIGYSGTGNVNFEMDTRLEQTIYNFSKANKRKPETTWRVQIYFGIGREGKIKAQKIKTNFQAQYPDIPAVIIFEEPYFKVRVGDCENRIDAERLKIKLSEDYDKLFIVEDQSK